MSRITRLFAALVAAVTVCTSMPMTSVYADNRTVFTYEIDGKEVTNLSMTVGETKDMDTKGTPKNSSLILWTSSNEKVATVDSDGVITAKKTGTTTIKVYVGNGSAYTSTGVTLTVTDEAPVIVETKEEPTLEEEDTTAVYLGTSRDNLYEEMTVEVGDMVDLNFYGVKNYKAKNFKCTWFTDNEDILYVANNGLFFAKEEGIATIYLSIVNKLTGKELNVFPTTVTVGSYVSVLPETPEDVENPNLPEEPVEDPEPTEIPKPEMNLVFVADNKVQLMFPEAVNYDKNAYKVSKDGVFYTVESMEQKNAQTVILTTTETFVTGGTYEVTVDEYLEEITADFATPDRLEVVYSSLGEQGKAYAMNYSYYTEDSETELDYRLYADGVDVTNTYCMYGYISYELVGDSSPDVVFNENSLLFYEANKVATVKATFTYWNTAGETKELVSPVTVIRSIEHAPYRVTGIKEWTLVKTDSTATINWDKPVHEVVAGTEKAYQLVVLITDNYGYTYTSDDRGINTAREIYSLNDYKAPYAYYGGQINYVASTNSNYYVGAYGEVYAFDRAGSIPTRVQYLDIEGAEKNIGTISIKVLTPSQVNQLTTSSNNLYVSSTAINNMESIVCVDTVKVFPLDQYGKLWTGDCEYEISCTTQEVQEGLRGGSGSPAYMIGNTLVVNGAAIRSYTNRSSVQFLITELISGKTARVNVTVKNPIVRDNLIVVDGWSLGESKVHDLTLSYTSGPQSFFVDVFRTSGNVKVGVQDSNVYLSNNSNQKYTVNNCSEGDVYVTITGPNGKVLSSATASGSSLTIFNGRIQVLASTMDESGAMNVLSNGTYTVKATYITKNDGITVNTAKKTTTFTIQNASTDVMFQGVKSSLTEIIVSSVSDAKAVVAETFRFSYQGSEWLDFSANMIEDVTYSVKNNYVTIKDLVLRVPYDGHSTDGPSYLITLSNVNKAIRMKTNYN